MNKKEKATASYFLKLLGKSLHLKYLVGIRKKNVRRIFLPCFGSTDPEESFDVWLSSGLLLLLDCLDEGTKLSIYIVLGPTTMDG